MVTPKLSQHPAPVLFARLGSHILAMCIFAQIQVQQNSALQAVIHIRLFAWLFNIGCIRECFVYFLNLHTQ